ncbi:hypothetical protein HX833_01375 [Marine Group I thaumarchaeote]|uniref:PEFG-CTERM sorting domain-containing protein n=1 Tax=Marine Group I thaumarchaeote TaxID=2511932 RepID=A0A7K4NNZ7_9ARCH|nr:hypothetical protein [Marine Group I thaumarchaeote]
MKAILLLALSAIILSQSYGFAYAGHGGIHYAGESGSTGTITIGTDSSSYTTGEMINVSGSVSDYDESDPFKNFEVTLKLIAPNGNIVTISQIPLNSDGSYSTYIPAEGRYWIFEGEYTVYVNDPEKSASTTFTFILAPEVIEEVVIEEEIEISEEEQAEGCGEGTHLEDGVCMLDETTESTPVSTGSTATGFSAWVYSITFTVLIAFVIMIIFYVISRASRRKIAN